MSIIGWREFGFRRGGSYGAWVDPILCFLYIAKFSLLLSFPFIVYVRKQKIKVFLIDNCICNLYKDIIITDLRVNEDYIRRVYAIVGLESPRRRWCKYGFVGRGSLSASWWVGSCGGVPAAGLPVMTGLSCRGRKPIWRGEWGEGLQQGSTTLSFLRTTSSN